jgi:hypothetical protein
MSRRQLEISQSEVTQMAKLRQRAEGKVVLCRVPIQAAAAITTTQRHISMDEVDPFGLINGN